MTKTILITGSTDGIGLAAARKFAEGGHNVILHGRNPNKLKEAEQALASMPGAADVSGIVADLSRMDDVASLARTVNARLGRLDVLINNAGVLKMPDPKTPSGLDARFVVNTLAPYHLTRLLMPLLDADSRVLNLSSAAQSPVDPAAGSGKSDLSDMDAYAQSKLALTMWSRQMATDLGQDGPKVIAVNPGSLLASKMVKDGFGIAGNDIGIGAEILHRLALDPEFASASGLYFDNDTGRIGPPHPDAMNDDKCREITTLIETLIERLSAN